MAAVGDGGVDERHVRSLGRRDWISRAGHQVALGVAFLYVFCVISSLALVPAYPEFPIFPATKIASAGRSFRAARKRSQDCYGRDQSRQFRIVFLFSCPPLCPLCLCGARTVKKKPPSPFLASWRLFSVFDPQLRDRGDGGIVGIERAFTSSGSTYTVT